MMGYVLIQETKGPLREPPRLAWVICAVLGAILILPDFGWRHSIVEQMKSIVDKFDNTSAFSISHSSMGSPPRMVVPVDGKNRCRLRLEINGHGPFLFLADTGAPETILTQSQSARLGYDLGHISLDHSSQGWGGGEVRGAYVKLREIRIEDFVLRDFGVAIEKEPGDEGLLGVTFLKRLRGFAIADGECRFWW